MKHNLRPLAAIEADLRILRDQLLAHHAAIDPDADHEDETRWRELEQFAERIGRVAGDIEDTLDWDRRAVRRFWEMARIEAEQDEKRVCLAGMLDRMGSATVVQAEQETRDAA